MSILDDIEARKRQAAKEKMAQDFTNALAEIEFNKIKREANDIIRSPLNEMYWLKYEMNEHYLDVKNGPHFPFYQDGGLEIFYYKETYYDNDNRNRSYFIRYNPSTKMLYYDEGGRMNRHLGGLLPDKREFTKEEFLSAVYEDVVAKFSDCSEKSSYISKLNLKTETDQNSKITNNKSNFKSIIFYIILFIFAISVIDIIVHNL